ncbi:hypothetical protein OVA24_08810 [Luteolibacter sp. SL250]|uniref:hypothetical protein n=1 Tax=Luteolibacter sp. SL250 TaxID=2995170 RepID=UPI00226FF1A7|nr:hypothetical protein [Luteolibacter sp. SL250]WAC21484.1 hypothetical protein OVA24_08810 [Luteolibacter sp. SL250]
MKRLFQTLFCSLLLAGSAVATTIMVVPIYEPLSLHGTDGDDVIMDVGEALQASVMARPMALTGAFPEVLIDSIKTPHQIPTNNPNYKVTEANLLVLCKVGINGRMSQEGLIVTLDITELEIPTEVDLTSRQVLRLALIAVRKTLEEYQRPQTQPLVVTIAIEGATEGKAPLVDLAGKFTIGELPPAN